MSQIAQTPRSSTRDNFHNGRSDGLLDGSGACNASRLQGQTKGSSACMAARTSSGIRTDSALPGFTDT